MNESKTLKEIEEYISKFAKKYIAKQIYNEKLNKNLLYVYIRQSKNMIQVFDEDYGIKEIARIDYALNGQGVFISDFIVEEDFQRNGIGKSLFNIAMAHGDLQGSNLVYGTASPISAIYGVSNDSEDCFDEEKRALMNIYTKLGCVFDENVKTDDEFKFYQKWERGDRIARLPIELKDFVNKIIESETIDSNIK